MHARTKLLIVSFIAFKAKINTWLPVFEKLLSDSIHDSKLSLNLPCQDQDYAFSVVDQLTNATSVQRKNRNVIILSQNWTRGERMSSETTRNTQRLQTKIRWQTETDSS